MRQLKTFLGIIFLLTFIIGCDGFPPPGDWPPLPENCSGDSFPIPYVLKDDNYVIVKMHIVEDTMNFLKDSGIEVSFLGNISNVIKVHKDYANFIQQIFGESIIYMQPNFYVKALDVNDPMYEEKQWNLQDSVGGINAPLLWVQRGRPAKDVIAAVIDTGIDYTHEDASFTIIGRDFVDNDNDPMDLNGHGTHVMGTINEKRDNSIGAAGISDATVMGIRVLDENGGGTLDNVAEGIKFACDNGAQVINLSLGVNVSCSNTPLLQDVISECTNKGVVVVAAAGNDNSPASISPASCEGVISVGATNEKGERASYSNCGEWVSISAPGGSTSNGICQMWPNNQYECIRGTSMATPHIVAITSHLIKKGIQPDKILETLCDGYVKPFEDGSTTFIGCGRLYIKDG
jgi:thermitase